MRASSSIPMTSMVALALLLGCGTESAEILSPPIQSAAQLVADDAPQYSDWSAPVNLGPVVNSTVVDIDPSISKDGLSLYFDSNRPGGFGGWDIWVAQRASTEMPWGTPRNLGPIVNTAANEQGPALTRDEHRLFFFSNRPGGIGGNDLYVARRRDRDDDLGWRSPTNLGSGVNTSFNDNLPHFFEDPATETVTLYFNSNRPGGCGITDIYAANPQPDGTFGATVLVPELCSPERDAAPSVRRDGLELIMASDRAGTIGSFDLWVATRARTSDPWSTPLNLGPVVNSAAGDSRGALSFDGTTLYLESGRPGGSGNHDLWVSTRTKLKGD